jgi:hypothetical protein
MAIAVAHIATHASRADLSLPPQSMSWSGMELSIAAAGIFIVNSVAA